LVNVPWAYTIFRFLEFFCENASYSKLRGKKIVFFGLMDVWSFEEKYGQACAGANQQELTTSAQKGGQ
jgi:hypothetical protein